MAMPSNYDEAVHSLGNFWVFLMLGFKLGVPIITFSPPYRQKLKFCADRKQKGHFLLDILDIFAIIRERRALADSGGETPIMLAGLLDVS